jgi:hypothetical protein
MSVLLLLTTDLISALILSHIDVFLSNLLEQYSLLLI